MINFFLYRAHEHIEQTRIIFCKFFKIFYHICEARNDKVKSANKPKRSAGLWHEYPVINDQSSLHYIWEKSQYWRLYVMNCQDEWWALPTVVNLLLVMGSESTSDWRRSRLIARSIRSTSRCRPDIRSLVSMSSSSSARTNNSRLTDEPCSHHNFEKNHFI